MIRKISMDDLHEFGENKKLKADEIVSPILANVPPNVLSAIEEVQRKAAATVTQPGRNNSINQNNLKGKKVDKVIFEALKKFINLTFLLKFHYSGFRQ